MLVVYNGRFQAVEVPEVGGVVLTRGEPKDIADTPKSRQLLEQPDFALVEEKPEGAESTSRKKRSAKSDAEEKEGE
ncbi:hypothetical protein [Saccharopolyspora mangrovi]|uniref:Uncharacterized protein n=1 Tax=Saccharopolyspora mangrovi TaxID=3082379 RepID=A0ABU6A772_9PSEU|nr:hypothetical protein [Saccharopolyspora sp. S2-29]MEB3367417.1 hypothetical protein [Saccharopolyspora sp. S2-29]